MKNIFNNPWVNVASLYGIALLLAALYMPGISTVLGVTRMPLYDLLLPIGLAIATIGLVELVKFVKNKALKIH